MNTNFPAQNGVALVTALIVLLVTTVIALGAVRYTAFGKRVSLNDELRVMAFQNSQSIVDATITRSANTPVFGAVGATFCTPAIPNCTLNTVVLADNAYAADVAARKVSSKVTRLGPELSAPPRRVGTSVALFAAAKFEVEAIYDKTDEGLGRSHINEGLILIVPR